MHVSKGPHLKGRKKMTQDLRLQKISQLWCSAPMPNRRRQASCPQLLLQLFTQLQVSLLPLLQYLTSHNLSIPTSTSKLQVFLKVRCRICCGIYVFLNRVRLCYHIYQVLIFFFFFFLLCHG